MEMLEKISWINSGKTRVTCKSRRASDNLEKIKEVLDNLGIVAEAEETKYGTTIIDVPGKNIKLEVGGYQINIVTDKITDTYPMNKTTSLNLTEYLENLCISKKQ